MVSVLSIINMAISLILIFGFPIFLVIFLIKKGFSTLKVFLIGMLGFFVTQVVIRIPLISFFGTQDWYLSFAADYQILFFVILALTAGMFETFGRFFVFKVMLKKNRTHGDGLMAGLGHGGIEAILLVGLTYISNIVTSMMINAGALETIIAQSEGNAAVVSQLSAAVRALTTTPSSHFLFGGIERVLTMVFHISLSLLVLEGIKRKKSVLFVPLTIIIHGLLDFIVVYMSANGISMFVIELVVLAFALIGLFYILISRRRFKNLEESADTVNTSIE